MSPEIGEMVPLLVDTPTHTPLSDARWVFKSCGFSAGRKCYIMHCFFLLFTCGAYGQIRSSMASRGLTVVGWYHSHPYSEPRPSQNDVLAHKKYQDATTTELGEEPCVGLIISEDTLLCRSLSGVFPML